MKGKIGFDPRMNRFYVSWYYKGRTHKIWYYNGLRLTSKDLADRLLAVMRGDEQRGVFRIERYLNQKSEISPLIDKWLDTIISRKAPATLATYTSLMNTHVKPFFDGLQIGLHEIDYGMLMDLNFTLPISEVSKKMLFRALKSFMEYAKKTGRLETIPIFPSRDDFSPEIKPIQWLPEERQLRIIESIPVEHQPIYWFLKYHMRRPAEACALMKSDFDGDVFTIRRTFSNMKLREVPKHKRVTYVPMVDAFRPIYDRMRKSELWMSSPHFFINPIGKTETRHYDVKGLRERWNTACKKTGEKINLYAGLKHSSASQLINECGLSKFDVQIALDCSLNTVGHYATAEVSTRKAILDRAFKRRKVAEK